ncbi:NAD(P)-dependent oxidoreductase [Azotosporobacter soli]|uniref:NAD(P)-dependent oxidoreductase n=1 Tax=Azotosporobacter soli TaxID=3055040 RepID=UPI0031FEBF9D
MHHAVLLNAAKLNFDGGLDFSPLAALSKLTLYPDTTPEQVLERVAGQDIVITKEMPIPADLIRQFPASVRLLCEAGTGYNNIDIEAAREKNIAVCNIPSYSSGAVAQLVITYLLNFSSSLLRQQRMLLEKNYDNFTKFLQVPHFELQGKTLGLIGGNGAIGREVAKIALALGMNILVYSRRELSWESPQIRHASLDELLRQSDFISLHCPLTPDTRYLIDEQRLRLMKPSAFLINTARGPLIQEQHLIAALQQGIIAGAALDVQDPEPPSPDNPLFTMDNVILTPHIGWRRLESRQRLIGLLADNIKAFQSGAALNVVNK